ncbi:MAG: hypothetical protein HZA14_03645 [Nitrospirae bacterium]|nr:hypothetical protein [Nitrospirota bacterium]
MGRENINELLEKMMGAGANAFADKWDDVASFAQIEFKTLSSRIIDIAEAYAKEDIKEETAKLLLTMQVNLMISALAGATSLTYLAVEAAVNAMLKVLSDFVSSILGFLFP